MVGGKSLRGAWTILVLLAVANGVSRAQESELESCLGDSTYCSEGERRLIATSCDESFYSYSGRVLWPPLKAVGPITISVKAYYRNHMDVLPVYVEILTELDREDPDRFGCTTGFGLVVMEVRGTGQCGGVWQSMGPLDITRYVPIGSVYGLRLTFFQATPELHVHSMGVSCIRVTAEGTSNVDWGVVKKLYRNAGP